MRHLRQVRHPVVSSADYDAAEFRARSLPVTWIVLVSLSSSGISTIRWSKQPCCLIRPPLVPGALVVGSASCERLEQLAELGRLRLTVADDLCAR